MLNMYIINYNVIVQYTKNDTIFVQYYITLLLNLKNHYQYIYYNS